MNQIVSQLVTLVSDFRNIALERCKSIEDELKLLTLQIKAVDDRHTQQLLQTQQQHQHELQLVRAHCERQVEQPRLLLTQLQQSLQQQQQQLEQQRKDSEHLHQQVELMRTANERLQVRCSALELLLDERQTAIAQQSSPTEQSFIPAPEGEESTSQSLVQETSSQKSKRNSVIDWQPIVKMERLDLETV